MLQRVGSVIVSRMGRWLAVVCALALGCGESGSGPDEMREVRDTVETDVGEVAARGWETAIAGQAGALLSVWGDGDELWAVGADARDGTGPMVIRGAVAEGWRRVDVRAADAEGGHLWWVFGDASARWLVGEGGRVLRVSAGSGPGQTIEKVESGTDATLYGVWGASAETVWAVGGYVYPRSGPPTIVRLGAGGGEVVALPEGLPSQGTFFKVWGAAADDVWVVGEKGMVLHWDGRSWARVAVAGEPRLVTVHGNGADDVVAVGGTSQGLIFEGRAFGAVAGDAWAPLNGVFVGPAERGEAWAVGVLGQVLRRSGGAWEAVAGAPMKDWHGVWIDQRGDLWIAGGNLLSRLDDGTLVRFGAGEEMPRGEVRGLEPIAPADADATPETVDAAEHEVDEVDEVELVAEDDATSDAEESGETVETIETIETIEAGETAETAEAWDALEETEEVEDAGPEIEVDAGPSDAGDASDGEASDTDAEGGLELGFIENGTQTTFTPIVEGQTVRIVHGPQGGIHIEVGVRFAWAEPVAEVSTDVQIRLTIEGGEVARYLAASYPMPVSAGVCQSYVIPLIFDVDNAALYAGKSAVIRAQIAPPGVAWVASVGVVLSDEP